MKSLLWLSACVVAGGVAGAPAWGQSTVSAVSAGGPQAVPASAPKPATAGISLLDALSAAWQRSVAARQNDGQRRSAEAQRHAATQLWPVPPSLELSHRNDRLQHNAGQSETEIGVAVPLWLPGQRAARYASADTAATQAVAAEQVAQLQLAGEVREAAWLLAALQAELAQADGQAQALTLLADDVERRVRAGDLARADALAARAEQLAADALQSELRQRLLAARARWTLLTGLTAWPDVAAAGGVEPAPGAPRGTAAPHPVQQLASITTEVARKRLDELRLSRRDTPELTVGYRRDVPGRAEAAQGSLVVGLRLPFGTDDRSRPQEASARAELDAAQLTERLLLERLSSDQASAGDAHRAAQRQLDTETARARLLRERASLIDKSFRAGETPLPDLLRALASAAQADSAVARQTAALGLARAHLQQALGLLP